MSQNMNYTEEQLAVINYVPVSNTVVKVQAGPGTGKTTIAREFSYQHPFLNILYICYNKTVQLQAEGTFPMNVECRTGHSLGYQAFGKNFKLTPRIRATNKLMDQIGCTSRVIAALAIKCLDTFCQSDYECISLDHVGADKDKEQIAMFASELWKLMIDQEVNMTHDGYLKLWQLSHPVLNYDVIILDEAHDTNPVLASVIFDQKACIMVVGDSFQQMYSFRGAEDFMEVEADIEFKLTLSFRFTPQIAGYANMFLERVFGSDFRLIGRAEDAPIETRAYLSRTNAALVSYAFSMMDRQKIGFVGGLGSYAFNNVVDVYNLSVGRAVSHGFIKRFKTYNAFKNYAYATTDKELLSLIHLVKKYGGRIPDLMADLKKLTVDERVADVVLTTAHKAKGLEWDYVMLANDFTPCHDEENHIVRPKDDEANIIYVAMTRAKQVLCAHQDLSYII